MRRDKWIVISSFCMLGLCALPYGCGGKAVDQGDKEGGDGSATYTVGSINQGDGYISKDGSYNPVGRNTDGGPDGTFYHTDGTGFIPGCPVPAHCGDGIPIQSDGAPVGYYYGEGTGEGWDENHGDGVGPEGEPNNADGAAPEGAADGWAG